jgi:hypothetical protein
MGTCAIDLVGTRGGVGPFGAPFGNGFRFIGFRLLTRAETSMDGGGTTLALRKGNIARTSF